MKPAHIDAIHDLARHDPTVHVFMRLKYQEHMHWDDVLAQMVLHLVKEKADLTARLIDAVARRAPAQEEGAVGAAGKEGAAPLKRCAAGRDGECSHSQCPQLRDNEPAASGRHCPLDTTESEGGHHD